MRTAVAATRAHHAQLLTIRQRTVDLVGQAWGRFGGPDDEDQDNFISAAVPIVEGAQRRTASLMDAYISRLTGLDGGLVDIDNVVANARRGVDATTVYGRPTVTVRMGLGAGLTFVAAMSRGLTRAEVMSATDVVLSNRLAAQDAMEAANEQTGGTIVGYERVLSASACEFCQLASTQRYQVEDLEPLHDRCDCDVAPIIGDKDPGRVINREQLAAIKAARESNAASSDGSAEPAPDVVVKEHGELGPVLVNEADHFKSTDDLSD